jgi:hypothetical protein
MKTIIISLFAVTVLLSGCKMEDRRNDATPNQDSQDIDKTTPDQDTRTR